MVKKNTLRTVFWRQRQRLLLPIGHILGLVRLYHKKNVKNKTRWYMNLKDQRQKIDNWWTKMNGEDITRPAA